MKTNIDWHTGVTCAVALSTAILGGQALAISQAIPGEALLIPYVIYDSSAGVNTLTGITIAKELGQAPVQHERGGSAKSGSGFTTVNNEAASDCDLSDPTVTSSTLNYFFFDVNGALQHSGTFPTGCDDWHALDWGGLVSASGISTLDGMLGYMLIAQKETVAGNHPEFAMWGDTIVIVGNWATAAYIPVLPLTDTDDSLSNFEQGYDEVKYSGGQPIAYAPLTAGMGLDNDDGDTDEDALFNLRYFFEPSLGGATEWVIWLDQLCRGGMTMDGCNRTSVPVVMFDTDRSSVSVQSIDLSKRLNVIDPVNLTRPGSAASGFGQIKIPEAFDDNSSTHQGPDHAGVAFSLIHFNVPGSPEQIQTILAHEHGIE